MHAALVHVGQHILVVRFASKEEVATVAVGRHGVGSAISFMLTNLGALNIVLGSRRFTVYCVCDALFPDRRLLANWAV